MGTIEFDDLCRKASQCTSEETRMLRDQLSEEDGVIVLEIACGRRSYELNAADELAERLERIGVAESLDILKAWEGGQRG
jgi:hypothetical protein